MKSITSLLSGMVCFGCIGMAVFATLAADPVSAIVYAAIASVTFLVAIIAAGPSDA